MKGKINVIFMYKRIGGNIVWRYGSEMGSKRRKGLPDFYFFQLLVSEIFITIIEIIASQWYARSICFIE